MEKNEILKKYFNFSEKYSWHFHKSEEEFVEKALTPRHPKFLTSLFW